MDLVLGTSCAGCGRPGRLLCRACESDLPSGGRSARPSPCPPGLAPTLAAGEYDALLKVLVNAHKERQQFALARPLGRVLGGVVLDLARSSAQGPGPWMLVPVPSRGSVVRVRGHDPMLRVARNAAAYLRRRGARAVVARLLVQVATARDQTGLGAQQRFENLAGSMRCRPGAPPPGQRRGRAVVVDDVVTTGATVREAQRALEDAGVEVSGIAAIAATRRRAAPLGGARDSGCSLPISDAGD